MWVCLHSWIANACLAMSKMTYFVSGGSLNTTSSLTRNVCISFPASALLKPRTDSMALTLLSWTRTYTGTLSVLFSEA